MTTKRPAALIVAVGQTDVQLVEDGQRFELKKKNANRLHREIEHRGFVLVAPPAKGADARGELPRDGDLVFCTPKADAYLAWAEQHELDVKAALILDTRRDDTGRHGEEDPVMAGRIVGDRLRDRCTVEPRFQTYLSGRESLEADTPDGEARAGIRAEVIDRIDGACRDLVSCLPQDGAPWSIIVGIAGGFPGLKDLVAESTRLRARLRGIDSVRILHVPDRRRSGSPGPETAEEWNVVAPHISFEARRHAIELLQEGHVLGAFGAVRHLHDPNERDWTHVFAWLSRWAASLPLPDDCDIALLRDRRDAVRAALRVELALRAGHVPEAVHATVAFLEAAIWDHLLRGTGRYEVREADTLRRLYTIEPAPPDCEVQQPWPTGASAADLRAFDKDNRKRPFARVDGDKYSINTNGACANHLAEYIIEAPKLTALLKHTDDCRIRSLRNDAAHGVPTPATMERARTQMAKSGVWSSDGKSFLSQACVQQVLRELPVPEDLGIGPITYPESLLDQLLNEVRARLG
ncbi:MAG: hypothetical protein KF817_03030 [Phycisphaeraceae bacterium]|nr:hypothetical protein [Phycisphaeraceae bacterium]